MFYDPLGLTIQVSCPNDYFFKTLGLPQDQVAHNGDVHYAKEGSTFKPDIGSRAEIVWAMLKSKRRNFYAQGNAVTFLRQNVEARAGVVSATRSVGWRFGTDKVKSFNPLFWQNTSVVKLGVRPSAAIEDMFDTKDRSQYPDPRVIFGFGKNFPFSRGFLLHHVI